MLLPHWKLLFLSGTLCGESTGDMTVGFPIWMASNMENALMVCFPHAAAWLLSWEGTSICHYDLKDGLQALNHNC